jgi:hypothetical protein
MHSEIGRSEIGRILGNSGIGRSENGRSEIGGVPLYTISAVPAYHIKGVFGLDLKNQVNQYEKGIFQ